MAFWFLQWLYVKKWFLIAFYLVIGWCLFCGQVVFRNVLCQKYFKTNWNCSNSSSVFCCNLQYNAIQKNEIIAIIFYIGIFIILFDNLYKKLSKQSKHFNFGQIIIIMALEFLFAIYTLIGLPEFYRCDPYQVGDYVQVWQIL